MKTNRWPIVYLAVVILAVISLNKSSLSRNIISTMSKRAGRM